MKKFVEENFDAMLKDLYDLVKHNSVFAQDEKPFGKENRNVLDEALRMMNEKGFETNNVDYYAGYGQIGQGDKTIGIVCHLDVVPAGDGWDSDPFELTIRNNHAYGRGVSDDKGAAIASMYAMKYLKDTNYPLKKKVRLILGCNEETGSRCVEYYVNKCGHPDMGFTPDASFPGIYAEKGIIGGLLKGKSSKILKIEGGEARNIVCKQVKCELLKDSFNIEKFETYLKENNIKYELIVTNNINVVVHGVAAHGASPELGINAINYLFEALYYADINDEFVDFMHKYIGLDLNGVKMGFDSLKDDATWTTCNLGIIKKDNDLINITVDIRFPIKTHIENCKELLNKVRSDSCEFEFVNGIEPIYFDQDSPMVKAMIKAYQDVTGDLKSKMIAIGGGTYAKEVNNIIAFGCGFDKEEDNIHNANESLSLENFKKQVLIYIEAIKNLNEV